MPIGECENYANELEKHADIFCTVGRLLTTSLELKEVFGSVMRVVGEFFGAQYWSLLLVDEPSGALKFEVVLGQSADRLKGFSLRPGEGIAGWVFEHAQPLVVPDVKKDARFSPRVDEYVGFTTQSVVCAPLINGGNRVVGVIELINKITPGPDGEHSFNSLDMAVLSAIGSFTGIAIENAFLYQKVRELAMIDSLTGLNNRQYFNDVFHQEVERVLRYGHGVCVLMMDLDGFKSINDNHGHLVGDQALVQVAQALKGCVRSSDVLARYGGDEFICLMPQADEATGRALAGRIQAALAACNQRPVAPGVRLSLSIGVHAAGPENIRSILLRADQELYAQKLVRRPAEDLVNVKTIREYIRAAIKDD